MDLSPHEINRKQNITSWPEGDITELTARDQNRYQRRKSAIIDYFQSELSVEEISSRHRLPQNDSLETLARQCLLRHGDGRLWGFRALVPGVKVADCPAPVDLSPVELDAVSLEDEDEDTAEREAVRLNGSANVPPEAEIAEEEEERFGQTDGEAGTSAGEQESQAVSQVVEVESEEEKVKQEESPARSESDEVEGEQEEFSPQQESEGTEEREQEEFPGGESALREVSEDETEDSQIIEDEEHAEQPAVEKDEVVESSEPEKASEAMPEPGGPVAEAALAVSEDEESDTQRLVGEEREEEKRTHEVVGEEESEEEEDTEQEDRSEDGEDEEKSITQKLVRDVRAGEEAEQEADSQTDDEQSAMAERDTVEVARIEAEARRERVSAADTIVVPAAMLDALERASREADLAETETVETSAVSPKARSNGHGVLTPEEQQELTLPALPGEQAAREKEARASRVLAERRRD